MMLDENENIIERKAGAHFCVCLEFCTDAGAQDKHDQHCENAVFKEPGGRNLSVPEGESGAFWIDF